MNANGHCDCGRPQVRMPSQRCSTCGLFRAIGAHVSTTVEQAAQAERDCGHDPVIVGGRVFEHPNDVPDELRRKRTARL